MTHTQHNAYTHHRTDTGADTENTDNRRHDSDVTTGTDERRNDGDTTASDGRSTDLRDSPMMAHLLDDLEQGTDIGHYGRLTFVMIARHFMNEDEMAPLLAKQPDHNADEARALIEQVTARGYSPPRRQRILAWQKEQEYPICPNPDDPDSCNVYRELRFPDDVYEHISEYHTEKVHDGQ